jgi:hypothetical protein
MICILVNIIITNPTHSNLLLWTSSTPRFVTSKAAQINENNYNDYHLNHQFMPLATWCNWIIGTNPMFFFSYSPNRVDGYDIYVVVCKGGFLGGRK